MERHKTVPYISGNQLNIPVDFPGGRGAPGDSLLLYWCPKYVIAVHFSGERIDIPGIVTKWPKSLTRHEKRTAIIVFPFSLCGSGIF